MRRFFRLVMPALQLARRLVPDVMLLAGVAAFVRGCWMVRPWLAWLVAGASSIALATMAARDEARSRKGR